MYEGRETLTQADKAYAAGLLINSRAEYLSALQESADAFSDRIEKAAEYVKMFATFAHTRGYTVDELRKELGETI